VDRWRRSHEAGDAFPEEIQVRAIIVDDSRAIRSILRGMLSELGFEVHEAGDGNEGLQRLGELGRADLALVDWNMPVMNGLEFVRAVRSDPKLDEMRVMMVTTESDVSRMCEVITEGANEYVMKPFDRDVIRQKLELMGMELN
jgi:two-component system chemotaxis response regulator CheY